MAKKKFKKLLKKAGKAALIAGALYGATRLGRKKPTVSSVGQDAEDINIGTRAGIFPPRRKTKWDLGPDTGPDAFAAKGGRISKKDGGRTGKQFGGGLTRRVGGVGAPVRPLAYKHGGKVKSMGIATRGGGVAKR
jgi:hypothetical protein